MTKLKICGIQNVDSALAAAESGADFLGFVFVHGVRRQVTSQQVTSIIDDVRSSSVSAIPCFVGLFADQDIQEVNKIVRDCGLDYVQLCGDELPAYWDKVDAEVIKQIRVRDPESVVASTRDTIRRVGQVVSTGRIALLDKYEQGSLGGTGKTFDWDVAASVAKCHDVMLAGGLTPENVGDAIDQVSPWGVDVSSGVETNKEKNIDKIRAFADAVRNSRSISKD